MIYFEILPLFRIENLVLKNVNKQTSKQVIKSNVSFLSAKTNAKKNKDVVLIVLQKKNRHMN